MRARLYWGQLPKVQYPLFGHRIPSILHAIMLYFAQLLKPLGGEIAHKMFSLRIDSSKLNGSALRGLEKVMLLRQPCKTAIRHSRGARLSLSSAGTVSHLYNGR